MIKTALLSCSIVAAKFLPILAKYTLNAFAIAFGSDNSSPSWKKRDGTSQCFLFRHSVSLIVRHVFLRSVLYAVKILSKYCCLASFMSLMTFFSYSLNCFLISSYYSRLSGVVLHLTYSLFFSTILVKNLFVIHFSFLCLRLWNFFIFSEYVYFWQLANVSKISHSYSSDLY